LQLALGLVKRKEKEKEKERVHLFSYTCQAICNDLLILI
jgi:hypothetical protein